MTTRIPGYLTVATAALAASCAAPARPAPPLMTPQEIAALPHLPADRRVAYGGEPSQFGELRLPAGPGPHPVVVLIHGGCFEAAYADVNNLAPIADALKQAGIATWTVEYRRLGEPGGGWPGTYRDVGQAVDFLRTLAAEHALDLDRVVVVGHSAGGHLATWAAARSRLPHASPLYRPDPLPVRGVVDLAGPLDLTANIAGYQALCQDSVITSLMGGTPAAVPDRYAQASPIRLLPLGVPVVLIRGEHEEYVPHPLLERYVQAARRAGDHARLIVIPGVGHFELASPASSTWPTVVGAIQALLGSGSRQPPGQNSQN